MELSIEMCVEQKNQVPNDPSIIKSIITGDETWVFGYEPETKVQLSQ